MTKATYRWRRFGVGTAAVAVVLTLAAAGAWLAGSFAANAPPQSSAARRGLVVPPFTQVARIKATTPGYGSAAAGAPFTTVTSTWGGAPQIVPVLARRGGRLKVQLAGDAPRQQSAWIPSAAATVARSPYQVVVDLADTKLLVFDKAAVAGCFPAGVGSAQSPTPAGRYFVAFLARSPDPGYGPFVVVTSAIAGGVTDWQQGGIPLLTINGPLATATAIGRQGAAVTTGSVRLSDGDLAKLRPVPPGSPVVVVRRLSLAGHVGLPAACRRQRR